MIACITGKYCGVSMRTYKEKDYYYVGLLQGMDTVRIDCQPSEALGLRDRLHELQEVTFECQLYANAKDSRGWLTAKLLRVIEVSGK